MPLIYDEDKVRPLKERTESQRFAATNLLDLLEEDAWYFSTKLREARGAVTRAFEMEDMLSDRRQDDR